MLQNQAEVKTQDKKTILAGRAAYRSRNLDGVFASKYARGGAAVRASCLKLALVRIISTKIHRCKADVITFVHPDDYGGTNRQDQTPLLSRWPALDSGLRGHSRSRHGLKRNPIIGLSDRDSAAWVGMRYRKRQTSDQGCRPCCCKPCLHDSAGNPVFLKNFAPFDLGQFLFDVAAEFVDPAAFGVLQDLLSGPDRLPTLAAFARKPRLQIDPTT